MPGVARRTQLAARRVDDGVRLVTWNVHGLARPDPVALARALAELDPDVICLQEVRRHQARTIARVLGWRRGFWTFQHNAWYVLPFRAEGLAILARNGVANASKVVLSGRVPWFSHKRRVAQLAWVGRWPIVNTHLSGGSDHERLLELRQLLGYVPATAVLAADISEHAGGPTVCALVGAGWQHQPASDDCPEHIFVPRAAVLSSIKRAEARAPWSLLSDHLPIVAELA